MIETKVIYRAVAVATITAFAASALWYSPLLFGRIWLEARGDAVASMPVWKAIVAPLRELTVALVLAHLIVRLRVFNGALAAGLALSLWAAFHLVQMVGAILWDGQPLLLSAIHAGDWLIKMLLMTMLLSAWHRKRYTQASESGVPRRVGQGSPT